MLYEVITHGWISIIEREGRSNHSTETLLADLLFSAVFHSGIHTAKKLHLFAQLISNREVLFSDEQQIWFETTYSDRATNYIDDVITSYSIHYTKLYEYLNFDMTPFTPQKAKKPTM